MLKEMLNVVATIVVVVVLAYTGFQCGRIDPSSGIEGIVFIDKASGLPGGFITEQSVMKDKTDETVGGIITHESSMFQETFCEWARAPQQWDTIETGNFFWKTFRKNDYDGFKEAVMTIDCQIN